MSATRHGGHDLERPFACRTYPINGAVTPSLVVEALAPTLGHVPSSRFQTPARGLATARESQRHRMLRQPSGGARRDRTDDLMLAKHALSQLSYGPMKSK